MKYDLYTRNKILLKIIKEEYQNLEKKNSEYLKLSYLGEINLRNIILKDLQNKNLSLKDLKNLKEFIMVSDYYQKKLLNIDKTLLNKYNPIIFTEKEIKLLSLIEKKN